MLPPGLHGCASRRASASSEQSFPIGSNYGVPYPVLRNESSFLYDVDSFPLHSVLAEALGVKDLSRIHIDHPLIKDKARLLATLQNRGRRRQFHHLFDSFVTSHVIPLLHSQALSNGIFYTNRHQLQTGRPQGIISLPSLSKYQYRQARRVLHRSSLWHGQRPFYGVPQLSCTAHVDFRD